MQNLETPRLHKALDELVFDNDFQSTASKPYFVKEKIVQNSLNLKILLQKKKKLSRT